VCVRAQRIRIRLPCNHVHQCRITEHHNGVNADRQQSEGQIVYGVAVRYDMHASSTVLLESLSLVC
jgi:hypothetical protein